MSLLRTLPYWTFALSTACAVAPPSLAADAYPVRTVRIIAPFPPGSGVDIIARVIGQALTESLKQPFVVENRAGAGGTIGSEVAAKAAPDGYTLLLGNVSTLAIGPNLYRNLPYDPVRDFAPITHITSMASVLSVHPSIPARSLREFVALARAKPRSLTYASAGSGTTTHLGMELFKSMTKIDMLHVPYKGSAAALTDVIAGQLQVMLSTTATSLGHIRAGKLRPLGVTLAQAPGAAARRADHQRGAAAGLRGDRVAGHGGAGAHPGGHRDAVERGNREEPAHAGDEGAVGEPGAGSRGQLAEGVWRVHQIGVR